MVIKRGEHIFQPACKKRPSGRFYAKRGTQKENGIERLQSRWKTNSKVLQRVFFQIPLLIC